jgi:hypothetical protein
LKRPNRRTLFWSGLVVLIATFVTALVVAYRQQQQAPLMVTLIFPGSRTERLRNAQLVLTGQQPREPLFDGELFLGLEDTPVQGDHITLYRAACGIYAPSETRLAVLRDDTFHTHTNVASMQFPAADLGHSRFPFDSSQMDLTFTFQPTIPIEAIRITNRVPGFVLSRASAIADRNPDGSLRLRFLLKRNLFTQVLCFLILVAGLCFAILILATQTPSALGSSVAAFFFSLWSLRGVLASQIQTFPTILDYAIVLLCCFMLTGLIWRVATHPEVTGKAP